jgi:hypothetical protein
MRFAIILLCTLVSAIGYAATQSEPPPRNSTTGQLAAHDLSGSWTLRIENLSHKVITTMTIRFAAEGANSCMAGKWKRVIVADQTSSDDHFFPIADPLSYELTGDRIVIGRNQICDAYLQLDGIVSGVAASGEFVSFGIGGGKRLGYFSLTKGSRLIAPKQLDHLRVQGRKADTGHSRLGVVTSRRTLFPIRFLGLGDQYKIGPQLESLRVLR